VGIPPYHPSPAVRVLVVDDDPYIRSFVTMALEDEGYEVLEATNGAEALEVLDRLTAASLSRSTPPAPNEPPRGLPQGLPQVILLDMRMPRMDGWAFARAYRARPGPHAPIVVVTAARDAVERAGQIAAAGALSKPFGIDELLDVVARYARPSHRAAS
jgi:urea transport system substrate-binding protein